MHAIDLLTSSNPDQILLALDSLPDLIKSSSPQQSHLIKTLNIQSSNLTNPYDIPDFDEKILKCKIECFIKSPFDTSALLVELFYGDNKSTIQRIDILKVIGLSAIEVLNRQETIQENQDPIKRIGKTIKISKSLSTQKTFKCQSHGKTISHVFNLLIQTPTLSIFKSDSDNMILSWFIKTLTVLTYSSQSTINQHEVSGKYYTFLKVLIPNYINIPFIIGDILDGCLCCFRLGITVEEWILDFCGGLVEKSFDDGVLKGCREILGLIEMEMLRKREILFPIGN